jgi:hypothetical protein
VNTRQLYKPRRFVPPARPVVDPTGIVYAILILAIIVAFALTAWRSMRVVHVTAKGAIAPATVSAHGDRALLGVSHICGQVLPPCQGPTQ